jgi:hypothetical protein
LIEWFKKEPRVFQVVFRKRYDSKELETVKKGSSNYAPLNTFPAIAGISLAEL